MTYPNCVPLPAAEVTQLGRCLNELDFDAIYSAYWERGDVERNAKAAIERSIVRHIQGPDVATHSRESTAP